VSSQLRLLPHLCKSSELRNLLVFIQTSTLEARLFTTHLIVSLVPSIAEHTRYASSITAPFTLAFKLRVNVTVSSWMMPFIKRAIPLWLEGNTLKRLKNVRLLCASAAIGDAAYLICTLDLEWANVHDSGAQMAILVNTGGHHMLDLCL
jgi:hypothetical protein